MSISNFIDSTLGPVNSSINSLKDFMKLFKGIDLNTVQKALGSIDKAIETFKGVGLTNTGNDNRNTYEERPKYKYFED